MTSVSIYLASCYSWPRNAIFRPHIAEGACQSWLKVNRLRPRIHVYRMANHPRSDLSQLILDCCAHGVVFQYPRVRILVKATSNADRDAISAYRGQRNAEQCHGQPMRVAHTTPIPGVPPAFILEELTQSSSLLCWRSTPLSTAKERSACDLH